MADPMIYISLRTYLRFDYAIVPFAAPLSRLRTHRRSDAEPMPKINAIKLTIGENDRAREFEKIVGRLLLPGRLLCVATDAGFKFSRGSTDPMKSRAKNFRAEQKRRAITERCAPTESMITDHTKRFDGTRARAHATTHCHRAEFYF